MSKLQVKKRKTAAIILTLIMVFSSVIATPAYNVNAAQKGKVKSVRISNLKSKKLTLEKGKSKTLKISVKTKGKNVSKKYTFKSSRPSVVKAVKKGKNIKITAKKKGKSKITIKSKADNKKKYVLNVTVNEPVKNNNSSNNGSNNSGNNTNTNTTNTNTDGNSTVNNNTPVKEPETNADHSIKISSFEILNAYSMKVTLSQEVELSSENFMIETKAYDYGTYNKVCKIESVTTNDNKNYIIIVDAYYSIDFENKVKVSISGVKGSTISAEARYSQQNTNTSKEWGYPLKYNEKFERKIDIKGCGYSKIKTVSGLPKGIDVKISRDYQTLKISGTPTETGIYNATLLLEDELGNIVSHNLIMVIGTSDSLIATVSPALRYIETEAWVYKSIIASGGSGNYIYEIMGNTYGLRMVGSNILGDIYSPGIYNVEVKITDRQDKSLTTTVIFTAVIEPRKKVTGKVTDADGQPIANAQVQITNKDLHAEFISTSITTDEQGKYSAAVDDGIYDVCVCVGNIRRYAHSQKIDADKANVDFSFPLYRIDITSDDERIDSSIFAEWYDSDDNYVGKGNILYLKPGKYSLDVTGSVFRGNYEAHFDIDVTKATKVCAKVEADIQDIAGTVTESKENKLPLDFYKKYYMFIPEKTGKYEFKSIGTDDTRIFFYDNEGNYLTDDDDSGESYNFCLTYNCIAGQTYYLGLRNSSNARETTVIISNIEG
ncbi:MAG: carboxypeptidase regulatory-like domain-containing protein [Eubacterium sp.]